MDATVTDRIGKLAMPFGKFKGEFIEDIMLENRGYLEWFAGSVDNDSALSICIEVYLERN